MKLNVSRQQPMGSDDEQEIIWKADMRILTTSELKEAEIPAGTYGSVLSLDNDGDPKIKWDNGTTKLYYGDQLKPKVKALTVCYILHLVRSAS